MRLHNGTFYLTNTNLWLLLSTFYSRNLNINWKASKHQENLRNWEIEKKGRKVSGNFEDSGNNFLEKTILIVDLTK